MDSYADALIAVKYILAVVARIGHTVAIGIIAGIARAIAIAIGLIDIGNEGAVIGSVTDRSAVAVSITGIALTVSVEIALSRVGDRRAIVAAGGDTVAVVIRIGRACVNSLARS